MYPGQECLSLSEYRESSIGMWIRVSLFSCSARLLKCPPSHLFHELSKHLKIILTLPDPGRYTDLKRLKQHGLKTSDMEKLKIKNPLQRRYMQSVSRASPKFRVHSLASSVHPKCDREPMSKPILEPSSHATSSADFCWMWAGPRSVQHSKYPWSAIDRSGIS